MSAKSFLTTSRPFLMKEKPIVVGIISGLLRDYQWI